MSRSALCFSVGIRVLEELRKEFRRQGHGSMRRVSQDLGLSPDYISSTINSGKMDVGVFFAVLEHLGIDPSTFSAVSDAIDSGAATPPKPTLPHTRRALERFSTLDEGRGDEG